MIKQPLSFLTYTLTTIFTLSILTLPVLCANVTRKAGLAWGGSPEQVAQFEQAGTISWFYNWSPTPNIRSTDLEFVPMLWGTRQIDTFVSTINDTLANYNVSVILGPNEPNLAAQSNLTVEEGIQLWMTYMQPLKARGLRLASPAPTNAPSGPQWVADLINQCPLCTVDIVALHWYGTDPDRFIDYVTSVHDLLNRTIWITEWACQNFVNASDQCTPDNISQFMNRTQDFLESSPWVERYSWFGAWTSHNADTFNQVNALMTPDGVIDNLGLQYIGQGSFIPCNGSMFQAKPSTASFSRILSGASTVWQIPSIWLLGLPAIAATALSVLL